MFKKVLLLSLLSLLLLSLISCGNKVVENTMNTTEPSTLLESTTQEFYEDAKTETIIDTTKETVEESIPKSDGNIAVMEIKDYGTIEIELYPAEAPITVENFRKLINNKFYDGLTFHRIIEGFMMQGGDPEGTGMGGSDENIKGEFSSNGVENHISHVRGVISMARAMDPDSASSQFFICHDDATYLDGQYAAFGKVINGMDVVDKICTMARPTDGNGTIARSEQPIITKVTLR